jgi:1,4-dihydroxy-2-naphthoyl-CoA synthase
MEKSTYEDVLYEVDGPAAGITDTDHQGGLSQLSMAGLDVFSVTDEAREGAAAFAEKRQPDFTAHRVTH